MDRFKRLSKTSSKRNSNNSDRSRSVTINTDQDEQSECKRSRNYSLPEVITNFLKRNSRADDAGCSAAHPHQQPRKSCATITFFSDLHPTFKEVRSLTRTNGHTPFIPCAKFIEASEQFLRIFDRLDNITLMTLKEKMHECVLHMHKVKAATKVKTDSLLAITEYELRDEKSGKHNSKTPTLKKLVRNLVTINLFVLNLIDPKSANYRHTRNSFLSAYAAYMEKRHKWITQKAVHAASRLMCSYEQAVDRLIEKDHAKMPFSKKETFITKEGLAYNHELNAVMKVIIDYLEKRGSPL